MARKATGIDIDTGRAVYLEGQVQGTGFQVTRYAHFATADGAGAGWELGDPEFAPKNAVVGVTGREVNLRFSRVPRLADWQLKKLMRFEVAGIGDASDTEVAADFNVLPELPELDGEDVVLLAMARESLLEQHSEGLSELRGQLRHFTPSSIALYNTWLRFGIVLDDTVLVAYLGAEHVETIVVRGADLVFARQLAGGANSFREAIAGRFNARLDQADQLLQRGVDLTPGATFADPDAERATRAVAGAAGAVQSLLQSSVMFARTQVKLSSLKLDRAFVCGELAEVRGLDRYLTAGLSIPVEVFDPFHVVDTSKLDEESAEELERTKSRAVLALGLATSGSDPDAYAIEVLPERVAKRRDFVGGTLLLILAGLLAMGYLVYDWRAKSSALEDLDSKVSRVQREVRLAEGTFADTLDLAERNAELDEAVTELAHVAAGGELLARVFESLDRHLPFGFWTTSFAIDRVADEEFGFKPGSPAPVLEVEGRAREGVEPSAIAFARVVGVLREELAPMQLRESMNPDGSRFALRFTLSGTPPTPADDEVVNP